MKDQDRAITLAEEFLDRRLGLANMEGHRRYPRTEGVLCAANRRFAAQVLARHTEARQHEFDAMARQLAGGDGISSDVSIGPVWERTVIREALYNVAGLNLVDADVMPYGAVVEIPYSYRDTTAAGVDQARTFEGGAIQRAGVIQTSEEARPIPQKLSVQVSDEMRHLTAARNLDWEAIAENQRNASRIIAEDTDRLIFNEHVRAADEHGAVAVSNENLELQADGAKTIFVLANFPVVRPRLVFNLAGNQVGSTINPITVTYNSVARAEYDGTGTQAAGIYYVIDYNLGEIYLVDEEGAVQTPADGTAYTISYSYASNVYNFDVDVPSEVETDAHFDTLLYRIGLRKTVIEDDRNHQATMMAMRGAVMNLIEQARAFGGNFSRPGTDLSADGTLGKIKGVPAFKAWGGGLWMGDRRIIIGQRGTVRFRMLKPWEMGPLQPVRDAQGRFTGQHEAYGDQFVVVHTPTQLKRALTTLNVYSATARVAR